MKWRSVVRKLNRLRGAKQEVAPQWDSTDEAWARAMDERDRPTVDFDMQCRDCANMYDPELPARGGFHVWGEGDNYWLCNEHEMDYLEARRADWNTRAAVALPELIAVNEGAQMLRDKLVEFEQCADCEGASVALLGDNGLLYCLSCADNFLNCQRCNQLAIEGRSRINGWELCSECADRDD